MGIFLLSLRSHLILVGQLLEHDITLPRAVDRDVSPLCLDCLVGLDQLCLCLTLTSSESGLFEGFAEHDLFLSRKPGLLTSLPTQIKRKNYCCPILTHLSFVSLPRVGGGCECSYCNLLLHTQLCLWLCIFQFRRYSKTYQKNGVQPHNTCLLSRALYTAAECINLI